MRPIAERFKRDLDELIDRGKFLECAMILEVHGLEKLKEAVGKIDDEKFKDLVKGLPQFRTGYEAWYSEALELIKVVIPERLSDFRMLYEVPKNRKEVDYLNYTISDDIIGVRSSRGMDVIVDAKAGLPKLQRQTAILESAESRFKSSLFDIKHILQADLFDDEIAAARELLRKGFKRGAGAIAGVVLEHHLLTVAHDHRVSLRKKNPSISDLNEALKSAGVIQIPEWRHISLMADYRNLCDHKKDAEPTSEQVRDLLDGVEKITRKLH